MKLSDFTQEELELAEKQILTDFMTPRIKPHNKPEAFLIFGQPGAGKTTLASIFSNQSDMDIFFVSGDDYRKYHPRYDNLVEKYGEDAVLHTQKFAGKMTERIIQKLSVQRINLIIEGTLRTKEVPLNTCRLLKDKGYNVTLAGILVRPEVSYLSTIKRFEMMKKYGAMPRKTPKEHHDNVVSAIIDNLDYLYNKHIFNRMVVYNRSQNKLFDSNIKNQNPAEIYKKEFSRKLSRSEIEQIKRAYQEFAGKKVVEVVLKQYQSQSQSR